MPSVCLTNAKLARSYQGVFHCFQPKVHPRMTTSRSISASKFDADSATHQNPANTSPGRRLQGSNNAVPMPASQPTATFNWQRQWYPLAPISYLDTTQPTPMTILGQKLAIWQDPGSKEWIAFSDACPHRRAPLSEGRIDTKTSSLQCAYHGWEFNKTGACTSIPQAASVQLEDLATSSPRSCAVRYPTTTAKGLLWVWMDCALGATARASRTPIALPSELRDSPGVDSSSQGVLLGDWMMRDLPISWEYLVENLLDPSHVHYAHHGVIGSRGKGRGLKVVKISSQERNAEVHQTTVSTSGTSEGPSSSSTTSATAGHPFGFSLEMTGNELMPGRPSKTHFLPPSLVWLDFPVPSLGLGNRSKAPLSASMLFYAVPVAPGQCRIIAGYSTNALPSPLNKLITSRLMAPFFHAFQWAGDIGAHQVLDGDTVLLRYQEEHVAENNEEWKKACYMPAAADAGVKEFRRWLEKEGTEGPRYGPHIDLIPNTKPNKHLSHRQILDRYEQHTKFCPYCRPALRGVRAVRSVLSVGTSASFAGGFALAALEAAANASAGGGVRDHSRLGAALGLFALGVGCGVVNVALNGLEESFTYQDYVHSKK